MNRIRPLFAVLALSATLIQAQAQAPSAAPAKTPKTPPAAASAPTAAVLPVEQIVAKHVAARGGLAAWKAVQTLSVSGKVDAGRSDSYARSTQVAHTGNKVSVRRAKAAEATSAGEQVQLPFRLEMKRPHKSRYELEFAGTTAVQVYDGQQGWKLRPYLNRDDVEPFSAEELKGEADRDFEGPLLDYQAKGTKVELQGVEAVNGHPAYKLKLTLRSGTEQHVWIDAQSFLDVKVDGVPHRVDGKMRNVWVYQRDFRSVGAVRVPYLYETVVDGGKEPHRMIVDSVTVNPPLDDARFGKPQGLVASSQPAPPTAAPPAK